METNKEQPIKSFDNNWECPHCKEINDGSYQANYMDKHNETSTIAQCKKCNRIVNIYLNCFVSLVAEPVRTIEIPALTKLLKKYGSK